MLGTAKGAFLVTGDHRAGWRAAGPFLAGWDVYHFTHDPRTGALLAGASSPLHGPLVARSRDWGESWDQDTTGLEHGDGQGKVEKVWNLTAAPEHTPGRLYAGVAEAGLFRSDDGGKSWEPFPSLRAHPTRERWMPGGGGLCLHTILPDPADPDRLYVAISAAGTYRTDDAGETWRPLNRGVRAEFLPEKDAEAGHCVHKVVMDPADPAVLYQQNHCGVYRSGDGAESWTEISEGLPSTFGFPMGAHPRRGGTVFTVPLEADVRRLPPGGELAVWRTRDGGKRWEKRSDGLPRENAYLVVLREAMAVDDGEPCGVYIGTHTGHLFASPDEADSWKLIVEYLPPIRSVEVGRVKASW